MSPDADFSVVGTDAITWPGWLPPGSVALAITDPRYESLEKHRADSTTTRLTLNKASSNNWFTVFPNARFGALFNQRHRVLKKNGYLYNVLRREDDVLRETDR